MFTPIVLSGSHIWVKFSEAKLRHSWICRIKYNMIQHDAVTLNTELDYFFISNMFSIGFQPCVQIFSWVFSVWLFIRGRAMGRPLSYLMSYIHFVLMYSHIFFTARMWRGDPCWCRNNQVSKLSPELPSQCGVYLENNCPWRKSPWDELQQWFWNSRQRWDLWEQLYQGISTCTLQ